MQPALVSRPTTHDWQVEVFFDGECPLCRNEIALLRRWDRHSQIHFIDIAASDFLPADYGIELDQLMAEMHGRLPDGTWIRGVEVFRRLYSAVGLSWLVAVTRWPGIAQLLDWGYRVFARNRLRWTGRCDAACKVGAKS